MIQTIIKNGYIEFSKDLIIYGSKFSGIKHISNNKLFDILRNDLINEMENESTEVKRYLVNGFEHYFIVKKLGWDTEFFHRPMYKLLSILYIHEDHNSLIKAIKLFVEEFSRESTKGAYCFLELPSEANVLIQSLTTNGFRLVESRLHHYLKDIQNFNYNRFNAREANKNDLSNLARVASNTRNKYDRFHSDIYFNDELADKYLGKFAQESVNGFADVVIVPNEPGIAPNALFAVNLLKNNWTKLGANVSQLVLAAVDPYTCKGWYEKLLSEICYYLKDNGTDYLITNTQTTNKAPIHVNEKLGFKYSHTTHIFSISNV